MTYYYDDKDSDDMFNDDDLHNEGIGNNNISYPVNRSRHHHYSFRRWLPKVLLISGIAIVLLALLCIGILRFFMVSNYAQRGSLVGIFCAVKTPKPDTLRVFLTLFDHNGSMYYNNNFPVVGDEVILEGEIITYSTYLDPFIPSGYRLIHVNGTYIRPTLAGQFHPSEIALNSQEDSFFDSIKGYPQVTPIVQATLNRTSPLTPDGITYQLYVTNNGLVLQPMPNAPKACGLHK